MNIGEVLDEITATQHRLAVVRCIVEYLETFLPSDTESPEVFYVEEPCLRPEVPLGIVEEVLAKITTFQDEQLCGLEKLKQMETKNGKPTKREPRGRKPTPRKPAAKRP